MYLQQSKLNQKLLKGSKQIYKAIIYGICQSVKKVKKYSWLLMKEDKALWNAIFFKNCYLSWVLCQHLLFANQKNPHLCNRNHSCILANFYLLIESEYLLNNLWVAKILKAYIDFIMWIFHKQFEDSLINIYHILQKRIWVNSK